MSDEKDKLESIDDKLERIYEQIDNADYLEKKRNREYHDSRARQQLIWEQGGAKDDRRD
jgi:hypothetical protein